MQNKNNSKKVILSLALFVVIAAVMTLLYFHFKPEPVKGSKEIVAEVILTDGTSKTFDIATDEEYLRGALEEAKLISGSESEYGLFVTTVDGVTANDENQEWWSFSKDGESLTTGVDTTPIEDGDHFEITLTVGY